MQINFLFNNYIIFSLSTFLKKSMFLAGHMFERPPFYIIPYILYPTSMTLQPGFVEGDDPNMTRYSFVAQLSTKLKTRASFSNFPKFYII